MPESPVAYIRNVYQDHLHLSDFCLALATWPSAQKTPITIYQTTPQKARRTAHNNRELATTTRLADHAVLLLASDLPGYDLQLIDNIT
jgi:hypothetical protein